MQKLKAFTLRRLLLTAAAGVLAGVLAAGYVVRQASEAVRESEGQVAAESRIPFTVSPIHESGSGFEWISSPSKYTASAFFAGDLYLAGPGGIVQLGLDGKRKARFRVGKELPPAQPAVIAKGLSTRRAGQALYVATSGEGLLILDRRGEEGFEHVRADEAPYRKLTAVLPLKTGRVLLGSEKKGVLAYDGRTMRVLHPSLGDLHVTALSGDESSLWIGTLDRGVLHWHGGRLKSFGEPEGLPDRQVLQIAQQGAATYVATPLGVAQFRAGRFERVVGEGLFATALLPREGALTVGTFDEGVLDIPRQQRRPRRLRLRGQTLPGGQQAPIQELFVQGGTEYALAEDALYARKTAGADWARVFGGGRTALTDGNISALAVDQAGKLWIGYFDRGLDILSPAGELLRHVEDQHVFCINRIVHDASRGLTAVATANGLVMFDAGGNIQQVLGRDEGLIANHVTDVILRPDGMTVATPAGLTFIDRNGMRSLYAFHGLVNNHVYSIASQGETVLAGTLGGLSVLDAGVIQTSYSTANSELKHNWITAIVPVGSEWLVGTYGRGIVKLDAVGSWQAMAEATGRFEVNPNAMAASDSRVYAGTLDRGLYVYEKDLDRWTTIVEGLPSPNVTAVAVDCGYLYAGTNNGLVRIQEKELRLP